MTLWDTMHLFHKVNVTLLKLNVTAFGEKVYQPLILKRQDLILAFVLRDWESENSLSSYKREPRVVCKTSLKESIPKSEHLVELYAEREGDAIFLKWAQIPRIIFFSRGHESQEMGSFPRNLVYAELYCFVQSVR